MVKIDTLDKPYYNKRFIKAVRIKGLESQGPTMAGSGGV
jgi:hypothetical protein